MPLGTGEISERDAPAAIDAIYRDLKGLMQVGMVNLIYRRMATVPGVLEWCHGALRPLFADGSFQSAAGAAIAAVRLPADIEIPLEARRVAGIDGDTDQEIIRMLDDYNHGNSYNLMALSALHHVLVSGDTGRCIGPAADMSTATPPPPDLPPIIAMADMAPETAALIELMSAPVAPPDRPMIPSLYRHLAHWPAFLSLTAVAVMPALRAGTVTETASALHDRGRTAASGLAARLNTAPGTTPPDGADRDELAAVLDAYTRKPIPIMIAVGQMIRAAIDRTGE